LDRIPDTQQRGKLGVAEARQRVLRSAELHRRFELHLGVGEVDSGDEGVVETENDQVHTYDFDIGGHRKDLFGCLGSSEAANIPD
jgi:hypothetical protein